MQDCPEQGAHVPAIIYAAKSSDDPHGSIPTQMEDGKTMAAREGGTVVRTYFDEAKSAYHGSRGSGLVQAREHAARLASEHGEAMLVVQHTDRLARGDGIEAQHLVEVVLWALKVGVRIRSVQDPQTCESVLMAAMMGERNFEDSKRKSTAVQAGLRRTVVERGEWRGGILPAGYEVRRNVDHRGHVTRKLLKHHEDRAALELLWTLAAKGASTQSIALELSRRDYVTRPVRRDHKPRPYDAGRVCQILDNPFYAGIVMWDGEVQPVAGDWPTYTDPETFYRLKAERAGRCSATKRKVGRPVVGYLLANSRDAESAAHRCKRRQPDAAARTNRPPAGTSADPTKNTTVTPRSGVPLCHSMRGTSTARCSRTSEACSGTKTASANNFLPVTRPSKSG